MNGRFRRLLPFPFYPIFLTKTKYEYAEYSSGVHVYHVHEYGGVQANPPLRTL